MKKIIMIVGLLCYGILLASPGFVNDTSSAQAAQQSAVTTLANDPQDGNGFNRAHWITSINKMVTVFGGAGAQTPNGNNSLRAFDPVTNTWSYPYPNNNGVAGLNNRDNYVSFYVPQRNELWVWGGSHLDGTCGKSCVGARTAGIFSFASNAWTSTYSIQNVDASDWVQYCNTFSSLIKNCSNSSATMIDPAAAWSASANMGIIYGGSGYGAQNTYFLIEPNNLGGSQPYKMTEFKADSAGVVPAWRSQCMNCIVSDGKDFYLYGGFYQLPNDSNWYFRKDLWKFDTASKRWLQLPDAPASGYASVLTYDSDRNQLVAWAAVDNTASHIYVYDIVSGQWSDQTPSGLPCIFNQVGVYAPTAKLHLFQGGNRCSDSGNPGTQVYAINLSGTVTGQNVVAAASTARQTQVPIGFLDGIDASGNAVGWSYDPDASSQSNDIKIYIDNMSTPVATITTSVSRPDVNNAKSVTGIHGFVFAIPASYKDGKAHQLRAYGVDKTGNADAELSSSPQTFTLGISAAVATSTPAVPSAPSAASTATAASTPASGSTCYGGLCMPVRTWVARRLPERGQGPCSATFYGGCKEVRSGFRPFNGEIYYFAGDYNSISDYYGTLFTYDVLNNAWGTDYPHAGIAGDTIMDNVADEVPWIYDSTRDRFYWLGGWGGGPNGTFGYGYTDGTPSPNGPIYKDPPLTYSPSTKKWTLGPGTTRYVGNHHGVYDPKTDRIYMASDYNTGMRIVNPVDGSSQNVSLGIANLQGLDYGIGYDGVNGGNNVMYDIDIEGRVIYLMNIGGIYGPWIRPTRFYTFNVDTHEVKELARPPQQDQLYFPLIAWDSVNKVLFWWTSWDFAAAKGYSPNLFIYHPDSNTWEKDTLFQPDGLQVLGNSLAFDPQHNALVLMGSTENSGDYGHGEIDHLFIYRYGNGDGKTPPSVSPINVPVVTPTPVVTPPSPPSAVVSPTPVSATSTLKATYLGVTGEDKVGRVNQTSPSGVADFHVSVSGLRGTPTKVTITSDTGGIWETPFNGINWIIATQYVTPSPGNSGAGTPLVSGDYWFEQSASNKFHVKVRYADGTTDETDAVNQVTPAPVVTAPATVTQPSTSGPAGYSFCALENQTCNFTGPKSIAYGANNKFVFLNLTGGTPCTNAVFGDPLYGTLKACFTGNATQGASPTPTPVQQPTQTQPQTSTSLAVVRVGPSDSWCNTINSAKPGTDVILAAATYTTPCAIKVSGKAGAPVVLRSESADPAKRAVMAYPGSSSNVMDLSGSFLALRWLSFSPTQDGVDAIRIRSGSDIIIEQNSFTGIGGVSVAANDSSMQRITVRDNTFKDLKYTVLYFGCQDGAACQATDIVVERNLIDGVTTPYEANAIGYGVQIKLNSSATIRDNTIYRTKGPGIMVYGSNQGGPASLLEGNYVEGSAEEGGIVIGGGPAVVRNNILVGNAYGGISAQDYGSRGLQKNIWIVHNTVLNNTDSGINVQNWTAGSGNVVAFNAIVPASGTPSVRPTTLPVTVTGNVTCSPSTSCFEQPSRAPYGLSPTGVLIAAAGGGTEPWRPRDDFMGNTRGSAADVGALQKTLLASGPLLGAGLPRPARNVADNTVPVVSSPIAATPTPVASPPPVSAPPAVTAPMPATTSPSPAVTPAPVAQPPQAPVVVVPPVGVPPSPSTVVTPPPAPAVVKPPPPALPPCTQRNTRALLTPCAPQVTPKKAG